MKKVELMKTLKDNKGKVLVLCIVVGGVIAAAFVAKGLNKDEQAEAETFIAQETAALEEIKSVNSNQS